MVASQSAPPWGPKIGAQANQSAPRLHANQQRQQPQRLLAALLCCLLLIQPSRLEAGRSQQHRAQFTEEQPSAAPTVSTLPSGNMSTSLTRVGAGQQTGRADIETAPHRRGPTQLGENAQHGPRHEASVPSDERVAPGSRSWMINGAPRAQPARSARSTSIGGLRRVAEAVELPPMDAIEWRRTKRSQEKKTRPAGVDVKLAGPLARGPPPQPPQPPPTATKVIRVRRTSLGPPTPLIDNEMSPVWGRRRRDGQPAALLYSSIEPPESAARPGASVESFELEAANQALALSTPPPLEPNSRLKCRLEKDLYLDFEDYRLYTCANCYHQVPPEYFKNKLQLRRLGERELRLQDRETDEFVWPNESERIRDTFKDEEKFEKWRICCREAELCCHVNSQHLSQARNSKGQLVDDPRQTAECPGTWDGLSCWPPSAAGRLAWRVCPRVAYLLDFEPACRGYVTKQCFSNASWYINRYGHEWSDYSTCSPEGLYKARMLHAALAYVAEALIVTPALFIFGKFSNRGGNKRIRIMKSLLLYILMNAIIQALQRGFLSAGFFAEYRAGAGGARPEHHAHSHKSAPGRPSHQPASLLNATYHHQEPVTVVTPTAASLLLGAGPTTLAAPTRLGSRPSTGATSNESAEPREEDVDEEALIGHIFGNATEHNTHTGRQRALSNATLAPADSLFSTVWLASDKSGAHVMQGPAMIEHEASRKTSLVGGARRHRRNATTATTHMAVGPQQAGSKKRAESAWKAIFCWLLQMASRLVRLMGYAWMFTGGVYLCSALHFAPAEPPAKFIKILFFLTNAFPNLIFFAYVTARTLNEPSPLNLILKVPYYWTSGDEEQVERLLASQKVCWFEESKSERIEEIADLPNLILVASNVVLFVITLVILCRINRPGSTRPDTSPCAYFKAAGTLLFLYGGHYFFLAYRPESESCSVDTFMFYAFICIDVVQGIAISIVFCYMTQEGKTVIAKYWRTRQRFLLVRQITWLGCLKDKDKFADNGYHHTSFAMQQHNRFNQSTRSDNSGYEGHNDNVTELININDTQISGQF